MKELIIGEIIHLLNDETNEFQIQVLGGGAYRVRDKGKEEGFRVTLSPFEGELLLKIYDESRGDKLVSSKAVVFKSGDEPSGKRKAFAYFMN